MKTFQNPILSGNYPDPSICRVGEDYYLVCSSFEMTPGLPVFHSRDLVHWEQIANAMTAENGLHVERNCGIGGLMAPTIRYRDGVFYIINANFNDRGNYIITARDPRGPWSGIHWMDDVPGIDASLFFDNDGAAYVVGTGNVWDNGTGTKERGFWLARYDIEHFALAGEPVTIFNSALRVGSSPEAPHIYHVGDYYYLVFAEGGTEHYHAVMVARSKTLFGFYEGNPANPIMTHRHMGYSSPITNVGHADFVELPDGSWYAVLLGSRTVEGSHKNLGRETFLCPMVWERGWPLLSPETGKVEAEYPFPPLPAAELSSEQSFDDFDSERLNLYWGMWGSHPEGVLHLHDSAVHLRCVPQAPDDPLIPSQVCAAASDGHYAAFLARRQRSINCAATCKMRFSPNNDERAGLAVVQAMNHQLQVELACSGGRRVLRAVVISTDYDRFPFAPGFAADTKRTVAAELLWDLDSVVLQVEMHGQTWLVRYGENSDSLRELTRIDGRWISPSKIGCLWGTMIGMFTTGGGANSDNEAAFDWFELRNAE